MSRYTAILKLSQARGLLLSSAPSRLAYGMVSLAIFFKVHQSTDSLSIAGLAVGLNGAAASMTAGLRSSIIDRSGLRLPLRLLSPLFALLLIWFNHSHGKALLLLLSFAFGAFAPPINMAVRPLWKFVVPNELLRPTYAVDTAVQSVTGIIGPILATTLALSSHPSFALNLCAVLMFTGAYSLSFQKSARKWIPEAKVKGARHILTLPAIRLLIMEAIFIGIGTGAFDIGIPSLATTYHVENRAGWIFGALAAANIVGSLVAGIISKHNSPLRAFRKTYSIWVLISIPLCLANPDWSLIVVAALLGLIVGAQMVFYWEIVEAVRPQGSAAGAIGWLWTFEGTAASIGSMFGGALSQHYSPRFALALYTICIFCGFITTLFGFNLLLAADQLPSQETDIQAVATNIDKNH